MLRHDMPQHKRHHRRKRHMIIEQEEFQKKLKRINLAYFSDPNRIISISKGNPVVRQGEQNQRLYLILSGSVVSYRHVIKEDPETASTSHKIYKAFRAGPGDYLGVQSFFSGWFRSSSDLIAETDLELAYIDTSTPAIDTEHYGTLQEQFIPAIVHELAARNTRVFDRTAEKEEALRMLHRSEMAATLGQLSAGIAHELNNSLGVLARKTDFVLNFLNQIIQQAPSVCATLYNKGLEGSSAISTSEQRKLARHLEKDYHISQDTAKILAQITDIQTQSELLSPDSLNRLEQSLPYWELGHDLHDMKLAVKHASAIVRSVRLLGGGNTRREEGVNVVDSITEAVALVKSGLRGVDFTISLPSRDIVPGIFADMTELVQIWINLLQNACDALKIASTPNPSIHVECHVEKISSNDQTSHTTKEIFVSVTDNGPGVPKDLHEKIFRPNFTTKKKGLSFGLGLGLTIVRRIVDNYNGRIRLESIPGHTVFTIIIPTINNHGKN